MRGCLISCRVVVPVFFVTLCYVIVYELEFCLERILLQQSENNAVSSIAAVHTMVHGRISGFNKPWCLTSFRGLSLPTRL